MERCGMKSMALLRLFPKLRYNGGMDIMIDLPLEAFERLTRKAAREGWDVAGYVQNLAVRESESPAENLKAAPRAPGLHRGSYWIADDFDAPLPDSFWLGGE